LTLIELMVVIAIISIIAAIAVPAYQGYVREARLGTAKLNADSMRIFLEDYHLDNGSYIVGGDTSYDKTDMDNNFGWAPNDDAGVYSYTVTVTTDNYDILVEHADGDWIFCESRMGNCCDDETAGASKTNCP
jgi:prepilin-type N-terminal cleavage/methylation domain-containing protein